ncbi:MAG: DNA primase [Candidatus Sungbacteria bacterium]|nr:DNA primase [Candidatus Sungbacteria bacterium]
MPSPVDDIKSRLDLVELIQSYIRLAKAGVNYRATCPFHSEKTPSFVVSPARQIWHCFGCNLGGDHFKFVMQIEGLEFPDALELLAKRAGVTLRREDPKLRSERTRLYNLVEEAAKMYEVVLHSSRNPETRITAPLAYLKKRGLADETIKNFRLGYAPDSWDFLTSRLDQKGYKREEIEKAGLAVKSEQGSYYDRFRNRIVFPISDATGRVVGFSGRIFSVDPRPIRVADPRKSASTPSPEPAKYINTPQTLIYDKSRVLYGFDRAKEEIRKQNAVVLVEGQMDLAMSHQAGVKNAVAVSGTALSLQQLQTLKRLAGTIISSFDRDAAGEAATKRSLDLAAAMDFERKAAILPSGVKDPADAVLQNPSIWQTTVTEAKPIAQFFLETALAKHDRAVPSGKRAIAQAVLPEIKIISSEVEKAHWLQTLAREIDIPEEALWRELKKTKLASSQAFIPDAAEPEVQKNRRFRLEALILGTIIRYPEQALIIEEIPRHAFSRDEHIRILDLVSKAIAEQKDHESLMSALPYELREPCGHLAFQAEIMLERIDNAKERLAEVSLLSRELEQEWAREKLRTLTEDISRAERERDKGRLESLLQEFQTISQKV